MSAGTAPGTTVPGGTVEISQQGAIATVTLSNPGRRNTMTEAMWRALEPACARLADDASVRAVVVRGAGQAVRSPATVSCTSAGSAS